jgi:hypothetical protein
MGTYRAGARDVVERQVKHVSRLTRQNRVAQGDGHAPDDRRRSPTGIRISLEMLPRVFDLFAQADRSLARSKGLSVGIDGYEVGWRIRAALGSRVLLVAVTG